MANKRNVSGSPPLNDADEALLELLREGRVTPKYAEIETEWSRNYLTQRLIRLSEHGIVENLGDIGLYELRNDPEAGRSD